METKKEYKCDKCDKTYNNYNSMWQHIKKKHTNIISPLKCKYCEKNYKHASSKSRHEKTCDNKNKYKYVNDYKYINNNKNIDNNKTNNKTKTNNNNNKTKKDIKPENKENDFDIFKNTNNISNNCDSYSYIYLLQSLDINTNETTYKIGRTSRNINERLKEYSKCCKILLIVYVPNSIEIEKQLLNILKNDTKIFHNKKIGIEYFCCDNYLYIYNIVLNNIIKFIN